MMLKYNLHLQALGRAVARATGATRSLKTRRLQERSRLDYGKVILGPNQEQGRLVPSTESVEFVCAATMRLTFTPIISSWP